MDASRGKRQHVFRIQNTYFWQIKDGQKTVEGRLAVGKIKQVTTGDIIRFECGPNHIDVKVRQVIKYKSFQAMLDNEGLKNCLPDCANIQAGVRTYHSFPNYETLAPKFGVIALRITTDLSAELPVVPRPTYSSSIPLIARPLYKYTRQDDAKLMDTTAVHPRSRSRSPKQPLQ